MKLIYTTLSAMLLFSACTTSVETSMDDSKASKKGAWSKADIERAYEEIETQSEALSFLGEAKDATVDCYISKLEDRYDSFSDADSDVDGCTIAFEECVSENIKSEPGNWSEMDINQMVEVMDETKAEIEAYLGENTEAYLECYMEKVMKAYGSFIEADADEAGCTELATSCVVELGL